MSVPSCYAGPYHLVTQICSSFLAKSLASLYPSPYHISCQISIIACTIACAIVRHKCVAIVRPKCVSSLGPFAYHRPAQMRVITWLKCVPITRPNRENGASTSDNVHGDVPVSSRRGSSFLDHRGQFGERKSSTRRTTRSSRLRPGRKHWKRKW